MKRITSLSLAGVGLVGLAGLAAAGLQAFEGSENGQMLTVDVACDCRTFAPPTQPDRGGVFMVNGKIFPAGTLPAGNATNDPTDPGSIGDWICRGQVAGVFPQAVAGAYSSAPSVLNTQYYILKDGRALTLEGYEVSTGVLSITGGIGALRGASGDVTYPPGEILGTNATGCPNFRTKFRFASRHGRDD